MLWILIMAIMTAVVPGKARGACDDEEVLSLLMRHEIQVLLSADHTPAWVAEFTRTSIDTVKREPNTWRATSSPANNSTTQPAAEFPE